MKLRDFVVVAMILDLLFGVFLFGLIGGFAGGILLPESLRDKIMQVCVKQTKPTQIFFAKEDGTEDCDAVAIEQVLKQARAIMAIATFLSELKPVFDDTKKVVEGVVAEQKVDGLAEEQEYNESLQQYEDSVRRYWAKSGQPKLKND